MILLTLFAQVAPGGGSWLDDINRISAKVVTTGKTSAGAAAVVFILLAYVAKRTLGAVFAALLVAGVVMYGVNNTDTLQRKTKTEIGLPAAPAPAVVATT